MGWEFRVVKSEWHSHYLNKIHDCYGIHEVYVDNDTNQIVKVENKPYNLLETDYDILRDHIAKIHQCLDKQIIDHTGKEI
jgi:hypothetical protein